MNWLQRIFCQHTGGIAFVRNLYGDQIVQHGYKRSEWKCKRCGRAIFEDALNGSAPPSQDVCEAARAASAHGKGGQG
jgi:hypothetical protein